MYWIAAPVARFMVDTLTLAGLGGRSLCAEAGLDLALLGEPEARLPSSAVYRLYELATERFADPDFGLRAFETVDLGVFGEVGYVMMSSQTLKDALEHLVHFSSLLHTGICVSLSREGDAYRLSCRLRQAEAVPRQIWDAGAAALLGFCGLLLGRQPRVLQLEWMHAEPEDTGRYLRLFGQGLRFGAPANALLFARDDLEQPLRTANQTLERLHEDLARARLAALGDSSCVVRVRELILQSLADGAPRLEDIAERMCVSKRTLQRALDREGTQFKELLNDVRRQQARFYLRHSGHSLQEVAYLLGFCEHSSFYRACTHWFGMTPGQYRDLSTCKSRPARQVALALA